MPWSTGVRMLKAANLPTGQGWKKTTDRLKAIVDGQIEDSLRDILQEHVLCGEKFTKFYRVDAAAKNGLIKWIERQVIESNPVVDNFPGISSVEQLRALEQPHTLVAKVSNDEGIGLVYTSEIKITVREVISEYEVFSDPDEMKEAYDEVVGLKFKSIQLFNVVWVSHEDEIIEIRVDSPKGLPLETAHEIHSRLKAMLNQQAGGPLQDALDLFPLIESLYEADKDGTVVELGFTTSTGSVKLEKMRRTMTCLREELYHLGGKRELKTKIAPYRISVKWGFGIDGTQFQPELTLAGTSRGRYSAANGPARQGVSGATISNCAGMIDYNHVRDRIIAHFKRVAAQPTAAQAAE